MHSNLLEFECSLVQIESGSVAFPHVERYVFSIESLYHSARRLVHQLLRQSETAVRALHRQRRDVSMGLVLRRGLLFHLGKDVADDVA